MDTASWIVGLMRENYGAVGFIPQTTIASQYIYQQRFVLQNDESGRAVGYLLHGALNYGQPTFVSQHCIQYERRLRGYGQAAFEEFVRKCEIAQISSIHLRVAEDLPAVEFWRSCGFTPVATTPGGSSRGRMIIEMRRLMSLPLLTK